MFFNSTKKNAVSKPPRRHREKVEVFVLINGDYRKHVKPYIFSKSNGHIYFANIGHSMNLKFVSI